MTATIGEHGKERIQDFFYDQKVQFIDVKGLKAGPIDLTVYRLVGPSQSSDITLSYKSGGVV